MGDPGKKARRKTGHDGGDPHTPGGARPEPGSADALRPPTVLIAFRVPAALADRLDRLAAELSKPWHEMKRSEVARAAVERGLDALEGETSARKPEE